MEDQHSPESKKPQDISSTLAMQSTGLGQIGVFQLLQLVGSGGMGEVYEAEQERPVRRRVALKLIKSGMDTREVVARFESERQALALLNHPHIAQVYDAGSTSEGRPYFVMEYVRGIPIVAYCDQNRLSLPGRLRLLQQVCEGVQHAHQKGIIHRDLKSSNILVTVQEGQPIPKIIDFGVAKATGSRLTEQTVYTQLGQLVGTLEYMSPEQAGLTPLDIDTRSDVYSLGVLLYELLVGSRPFERNSRDDAGTLELIERIRQKDPIRPSARIVAMGPPSAELARQRSTDGGSLRRCLQGDLDAIALKALEKDRTRRYSSAAELAADIGRYLRHEPVVASPPSTAYRLRKFVRRHRVGVAASAAVTVALIAGMIGTTLMLLRAVRAERSARLEAETAKRTSDFLVELFKVSDPGEARGNTITAREILDKGATRIRGELRDQPLVQARLMNTMGNVYRGLGLHDQAAELLLEALRLRERLHGMESPEAATVMSDLLYVYMEMGEVKRALPLAERALAIRSRALGSDHVDTAWSLYYLGNARLQLGETQFGDSLIAAALPIFRKRLGPQALAVAWCLNDRSRVKNVLGDYAAALPLAEEAVRIKELALGPDHIDLALSYNNLGWIQTKLARYADARRSLTRALEIGRRSVGDQHPWTAMFLHSMGDLLRKEGRYDSSESVLIEAIAIQERSRKFHVDLPLSLWTLAAVRSEIGRFREADAGFRRSISLYEKINPDHLELIPCLEEYARMLDRTGRAGRAAAIRERAERIRAVTAAVCGPTFQLD